MISLAFFVPAVATILATPGPTNTLLATSGVQAGFRPSLKLVPAELCGYFIAITGWGLFLEPASAGIPWLKPALKLACAAYLVVLAWSLWRRAGAEVPGEGVGPRGVFVATLLNPKAFIFAVAVFPGSAFHELPTYLQAMGTFAATLVPIALAWIAFGSYLARPNFWIQRRVVERFAAVVLLTFSASLGATAVA